MDPSRLVEVFYVASRITEVINFGIELAEVRAGRAPMPIEGVRSNMVITGTVTGGLTGSFESVDYYHLGADGVGRNNAYSVITTEDGLRVALQAQGVVLSRPGSRELSLRQTATLFCADPSLDWVNRGPVLLIGACDADTYEIAMTGYAAAEVLTASS